MKKLIIYAGFIAAIFFLVSNMSYAMSSNPEDYIFWDNGDQIHNGTYSHTPADGNSLTTQRWKDYAGGNTAIEYDSGTSNKKGNMTIKVLQEDGGKEFDFGMVLKNATIFWNLYDDGDVLSETWFGMRSDYDGSSHFSAGVYTFGGNFLNFNYGWDANVNSGFPRSIGWSNFSVEISPAGDWFVLRINDTVITNDTTHTIDARSIIIRAKPTGTEFNYDNIRVWSGAFSSPPKEPYVPQQIIDVVNFTSNPQIFKGINNTLIAWRTGQPTINYTATIGICPSYTGIGNKDFIVSGQKQNITLGLTTPNEYCFNVTAYNSEGDYGSGQHSFSMPLITVDNLAADTNYYNATITFDATDNYNYTATIGACPSYTDVAAYSSSAVSSAFSVDITGLNPSTQYCFNATILDIYDNYGWGTIDFYSVSLPIPPVISNLINATTTNTSATLTWDTDIESNYTATIGICPSYTGINSYIDPTPLYTFSLTDSNLNPNVNYCFNVTAYSTLDGGFSSADYSFTTANYSIPPYPYSCISNFSISESLMAWYRFENSFNDTWDSKGVLYFWEAYPVLFSASSGSHNTGNLSASFSTLETGTMSLTDLSGSFNFGNTDKFSISFWVRPLDNYEVDLIGRWDYTQGQGYVIQKDASGYITARFQAGWQFEGFSEMIATSTIPIQTLKWSHIAMTYDGSSNAGGIKIYINGVESTQVILNENYGYPFYSGAQFQIGNIREYFGINGRIDEVAVYNQQLCQDDINNIYNYGASYDTSLIPHVDEQFKYSVCPIDSTLQFLLFALVYVIAFATIITAYVIKNGAAGVFGSLILFFSGIYMFPCLSAIGLITCATALIIGLSFTSKGWFNSW